MAETARDLQQTDRRIAVEARAADGASVDVTRRREGLSHRRRIAHDAIDYPLRRQEGNAPRVVQSRGRPRELSPGTTRSLSKAYRHHACVNKNDSRQLVDGTSFSDYARRGSEMTSEAKRPRVLVADDDQSIRQLLCTIVRREHFDVDAV